LDKLIPPLIAGPWAIGATKFTGTEGWGATIGGPTGCEGPLLWVPFTGAKPFALTLGDFDLGGLLISGLDPFDCCADSVS